MKRDNRYWLKAIKNEFYPSVNFDNCNGRIFNQLTHGKVSKKYSVEQIDSYGGEGFGNSYWKIFKIGILKTSEVIYLKFEGNYNSWEGVEWDDIATLVTPKQKLVTFYD